MTYKKVAVIGAGAMGAGIAHAFAAASTEVILLDISTDFVKNGIQRIDARCASDVKKGKLGAEDKERIMGRIKGTVSHEDTKDVELVIEAVVEDRSIKGELFSNLNRICSPGTIFATNTSTLSVTDLAVLSGRPERFIGLHFFNPVHAMKLVEVIPGLDTEKGVVDDAASAMKSIKKTPVVVQDCPGFLVNRILLMYICEALLCAQEGISPEQIDTEAKNAGFPMGPLELVDMVGIDVSLHTQPVLHMAYGERFPFPTIIQRLYEAGRLGIKTGKGFYRDGTVDEEYRGIVKSMGAQEGGAWFSIDRLILRQVNEAIYCLQEGVATPEVIDRAIVLGTGFPNEGGIGGPLHWADGKGLDWVLSELDVLKDRVGVRFWPHHLLKTYVSAGRLGRKAKKGFFVY
jgi:3-hydroxyacyl-CoA dehydrogenase